MIRVAYLCEFPSVNGGENSLLSFLASTPEEIEPIVLCPQAGPFAERLRQLGIASEGLHLVDSNGQRKDPELVNAELLAMLKSLSPQIVHANSLSMSRVLGRIANKLSIPCCGHLRDILKVSKKVISDLSQLSKCIAVSDATRQCYVEQGLDEQRILRIYNGITSKQTENALASNREGLRARIGLGSSSALIGGIGQIGLRKGWDVLLDAVEHWLATDPTVDPHVVIAGVRHSNKQESIEYEQVLLQRGKHGPLSGRVHLVGYWTPIDQFLQEIDVLTHPAYQEPLGRVLLEAAALGTPVIATDVGGTPEIFGESGAVLVPKADSHAMAEGLSRVLKEPEFSRCLTKEAASRVQTLFGTERHREAVLDLYRSILN